MVNAKKQLRKKIIQKRDRLSRQEIEAKSLAIAQNFSRLEAYQKARTIMVFVSFGSEVDTRPLVEKSLAAGKAVLVPRTVKEKRELIPSRLLDWDKDLSPGEYGIMEPLPQRTRPRDPESIDLLMVPGVAFDHSGRRLGYGGGYYDRFFSRLNPDIPLAAVAFELQLVEHVPVESWDRRVDILVTEERTLFF